MLTTYDRVLREWRRRHMCGSELRAKLLAARLERDAPLDTTGEVVPGVVIALTIKRAQEASHVL